eukprot:gnl/Chilomastix_cuspidata/173.p1 GENE.gnl/Chilomastix_cuspidata/173~~gnl/Chilomastix_cuspidata/173.p1  ORF type:complete len:281 (+),score=162.94 gnl/Chilomastix_cuspidata/173:364-1206(+)
MFPQLQSELEFYLVKKGTLEPQDRAPYMSLPPQDRAMPFRRQLAEVLEEGDFSVRRIHHENGPGQNEIEFNLTAALKNCDDTATCCWILDYIASTMDLDCLISPLPLGRDEAGNGLHQHIQLVDKDGRNLMTDGEKGLSAVGRQFVAGVLKYADEVTAVFARSQESFDRFQYGHEAPVNKIWGCANRNALVRIPSSSPATIHPEFRAADASGSIYLLAAALLAAGLRGIEEGLELCAEGESLGKLPVTPAAARAVLADSPFLKEFLSPSLIEYLLELPLE